MDAVVVHLMGWSLIRGGADDLAQVDALVRAELREDSSVAVELATDPVETEPVERLLLALQVAADDAGTRLAVVESDALARERFTAAGVRDLHESLDDATGAEAPLLRRASDGDEAAPLAPSSGDAITVAARDLQGG